MRDAAKIGSASDDEHAVLVLVTALDRDFAVALVCGNDDIREQERKPLKKKQETPKKPAAIEFRFVQFRIDVVVIEDIFLPQKLKWQRDEKDQIGRIAAVNSVETVPVEYVASEPQFMKQGARVLVDITERRCAFREARGDRC